MARGRKGKPATRTLTRPPGLTPKEAELWDMIVAAQEPAWHVPGVEPLLVAYIRGSIRLERYNTELEKALADPDSRPEDFKEWEEIIRPVQNSLTRLGAALRLNPHSRQDRSQAKGRPSLPWEDFPEATD